jgi:hypothetical protein
MIITKNLTVVIAFIGLLFLLFISIIFVQPYLSTEASIIGYDEPQSAKNVTSHYTVFDLKEPKITLSYNPDWYYEQGPDAGFMIYQLNRKPEFFGVQTGNYWYQRDYWDETFLVWGRINSNEVPYDEYIEYVKNYDLSTENPVPDKIYNGIDQTQERLVTFEDRYYNIPPGEIKKSNRKIGDFKSLLVGMRIAQVKEEVGNSDLIFGGGLVTGGYERHYALRETNFKALVIGFDADTELEDSAGISQIALISNDNNSIIIPQDPSNGTFDFDSALESIENTE